MTNTLGKISFIVLLGFQFSISAQTKLLPISIITSRNDTIRDIKSFDSDSLLIFQKDIQYWTDKSKHIFIDSYVYSDNKVVYNYHATEDFLRIIRYDYDSITGLREQLVKHSSENAVNNELLSSIKTRNDLIDLVESVIPKNSELRNILDSNEYHTLVHKKRMTIYTCYKNETQYFQVVKKQDRLGNLIYEKEQSSYQTTITRFKFNRKNKLVKRSHGFDDYLSEQFYFYENGRLVTSTSSNRNGYNSSSKYYYLDNRLVKEEITWSDFSRVYEYSYQHFEE